MKLNVKLVSCDDWEVAYFNGEKYYEDHSIGAGEILQEMKAFIESNGPIDDIDLRYGEIKSNVLAEELNDVFPDNECDLPEHSEW